MKKILCLFGAFTLLLTSCSSDDSSSDSSNVVLLKKNVITNSDGEKYTITYNYNGNKIVSAIDDSGELNIYYTYTGDLITKMEYKNPDGSIDQINNYSYNAEGKLVTFVRIEPNMDWGHKEVYTYNADGTVTAQSFSGDGTTQTLEGTTNTIKFVNGEVSEIISEDASWENHKYTYDNKNNATKNILGMDKIAFIDGEANGVKFNILTDTSEGDLWTNSTFTYNENGYPVKEVDTGSDSLGTIEYFY
ncbi:hypothetical protein OD917_16495 [Flavobacterium sp. SH_e]|uniref:hypothetical protein n=1 Tax=Flavobacterium TaxID=237 RepID=UPI0021E3C4F8|nr:hypothetical protein [Flavobacterium sp. SH_e]MCV2486534.1 hypothetical protein [Flavobacterium sp. SH_e]